MMQREVWSLSLGRWFGIQIRLHMFFLLFGTFTFYLAWVGNSTGLAALAAVCLMVLIVSVLLHELAHCFAALKLGGSVDSIVLGPLGGMRSPNVSHDAQCELLTALAGPLVSLIISLCCLMTVSLYGEESVAGVLNPILPGQIFDSATATNGLDWGSFAKLTCWINFWLCVLNLIPAYPFDGGRAVTALIMAARPRVDRETATALTATLARIVAMGLCICAFLFHDSPTVTGVPMWLPLVLLAIFVFFSTRVEESHQEQAEIEEAIFGYDFSEGYTSLEREHEPVRPKESFFAKWLREREEQRELRRREQELEEDERMDEILGRLHEHGIDSLTGEERRLLKRVSDRIRSKGS